MENNILWVLKDQPNAFKRLAANELKSPSFEIWRGWVVSRQSAEGALNILDSQSGSGDAKSFP